MVADDNSCILNLVQGLLEPSGHNITLAVDGREAVSLLESNLDFDVVITDFEMPGKNGLEVLAAAKTKLPRAKLWLMSGIMDRDLEQLAFHHGAHVAVHKKNLIYMMRSAGLCTPGQKRK